MYASRSRLEAKKEGQAKKARGKACVQGKITSRRYLLLSASSLLTSAFKTARISAFIET